MGPNIFKKIAKMSLELLGLLLELLPELLLWGPIGAGARDGG